MTQQSRSRVAGYRCDDAEDHPPYLYPDRKTRKRLLSGCPDFGPLSLDHLLEPYPYLPGLQRRMYEGVEDEGV